MIEKLISITYVQSVDFHVLVRSSSLAPHQCWEISFIVVLLVLGQKDENW